MLVMFEVNHSSRNEKFSQRIKEKDHKLCTTKYPPCVIYNIMKAAYETENFTKTSRIVACSPEFSKKKKDNFVLEISDPMVWCIWTGFDF